MTTLNWDKRLETGIPEIDEQHKEIFKRISDLGLAIINGEGKFELGRLIKFLHEHSIEHFKAEENLMMDIDYSEFPRHREQHKAFLSLCEHLTNEYNSKGADQYLAIETEKELIKWWENHILKMDMSFIAQFKKARK